MKCVVRWKCPHSSARVAHGRGGRRFGGAEEKNARGGAHFRGLAAAVSRPGGTPLHTCFGGGGRLLIRQLTRTVVDHEGLHNGTRDQCSDADQAQCYAL